MATQYPAPPLYGQTPPYQQPNAFVPRSDAEKYPKVPTAIELSQSGLKLIILPPGTNPIPGAQGSPAGFSGSYPGFGMGAGTGPSGGGGSYPQASGGGYPGGISHAPSVHSQTPDYAARIRAEQQAAAQNDAKLAADRALAEALQREEDAKARLAYPGYPGYAGQQSNAAPTGAYPGVGGAAPSYPGPGGAAPGGYTTTGYGTYGAPAAPQGYGVPVQGYGAPQQPSYGGQPMYGAQPSYGAPAQAPYAAPSYPGPGAPAYSNLIPPPHGYPPAQAPPYGAPQQGYGGGYPPAASGANPYPQAQVGHVGAPGYPPAGGAGYPPQYGYGAPR